MVRNINRSWVHISFNSQSSHDEQYLQQGSEKVMVHVVRYAGFVHSRPTLPYQGPKGGVFYDQVSYDGKGLDVVFADCSIGFGSKTRFHKTISPY